MWRLIHNGEFNVLWRVFGISVETIARDSLGTTNPIDPIIVLLKCKSIFKIKYG